MRPKMRLLAATVIAAVAPLALAQATGGTGTGGTTTGGTVTTTTTNAGQTLVATKIASNFTNLAGSTDNALALVNALRTGTDVTLTSTVAPPAGSTEPPTTTTTTFTPPTGKMGWGNVFNSLALAQDSLARLGITNPTNEQLQAALMGGDVTVNGKTTTLKGILQMRADGMGWGQIAQATGTKLGPVVSSIRSAQHKVAALPPATTSSSTVTSAASAPTATGKSSHGVTTAAGTSGVNSGNAMKGITTAAGASAGTVTAAGGSGHGNSANAPGRGVVTAAGGAAGTVTVASGGSHGQGAGIVNADGANAASVSNAGGNGKGNAGGNGKGKGGG